MDKNLEQRIAVLEADLASIKAQLCNTMMVQSPADIELEARAGCLLSLLAPERDLDGTRLVRVGSAFDGGYVIPEEISFDKLLAFGIGSNCDFEEAMVGRGVEVEAFDHTIDTYPADSTQVVWRREALAASAGNGRLTLADAIEGVDGTLLVKMDVEGDEWKALDVAQEVDLKRIACLVVELHDLDRLLVDVDWQLMVSVLERVRRVFALVHIHANNAGSTFRADGRLLPSILECTYVSRTLVGACVPARGPWPTPLDAPNLSHFPDLELTELWRD